MEPCSHLVWPATFLRSRPGLGSILLTPLLWLSLLTPRDTGAQTTVNKQGGRLILCWIPAFIRMEPTLHADQYLRQVTWKRHKGQITQVCVFKADSPGPAGSSLYRISTLL